MILAFIELVKDFSPSNLRNIDDGTVVQYIKQSMYHYCFRIYKKYHHVETVIGWDEISPKEEAEYLATQDKIQLNDGLLTELQIDVLTKREREIITLMFEKERNGKSTGQIFPFQNSSGFPFCPGNSHTHTIRLYSKIFR